MIKNYHLDTFHHENRILYTVKPLHFKVIIGSDELFKCMNEYLEIFILDDNFNDLYDDVCEELFFLYDQYYFEPDENLTDGAKVLKNKLHEIVKNVESI